MILAPLAQAERYRALHPLFAQAFDFLQCTDLHALARGVHPVLDDRIFAIVEVAEGRTRDAARLECHRRYIDIQLVLEGVDEMGWRTLSECTRPLGDYDRGRDIRFFADAPAAWIATHAGSFCVFFPEDAHAPLVSRGRLHKVVMKVAVDATAGVAP